MEVSKHPLGAATTIDAANDGHAAVAAGYWDRSSTRTAGWPSRFLGPESLSPWPRCMRWAQEVRP